MAGLPPDGRLLVQQIDGQVIIYNRDTEEELHRLDPADPNSFGPALQRIWLDDRLAPEQKCFSAFWVGYFHAHS